MVPENGSLQNRRRNLILSQGNVEVSIT